MRTPTLALLAVLAVAPAHAADPIAAARQRLQRGNYAEARDAYGKLLVADATRVPAAVGLAAAWRAEGEHAKALAVLDDALKAAPDTPDLLAHRADLLFDLGRWDDARTDAQTALGKDDRHFLARWVRARILRDRGDTDEAAKEVKWFVRAYSEASDNDKDITDPDLLALVGQAGAENARWNNLSKQFSFIINDVYADTARKHPDFWQAEYFAGRLFLEKYNKADAEDAFDNALKVNPKAADALVGKGLVALQTYDLKEAGEYADRALVVNPRHVEGLRLRAALDMAADDAPAALRRLTAARAVNPRDAVTLGKLAAGLTLLKRADEFAAVVKEAEGYDAKPTTFYLALGEALDERKHYGGAEECLRKAAAARPNVPAPRAALGTLLMRLGREADARAELDAAYKADPFNVRVFNARKVLTHLEKYATIETAHYRLKYDPKADAVLAAWVAEQLEEVHAGLKRQYGYEPPDKVLVELFSTHEMFSGRIVALPDLHTVGACTGRIMALASPHAKDLPKQFNWSRVIRHELVHVFNLAQTEFLVPHWLTEGLAVRNEGGGKPPQWYHTLRDRAASRTLFDLDTVTLGFVRPKDQDEWALAYFQSNLYVEYVVKTHGEAAVGKLIEAYKTETDAALVLRKALGVDKAEFETGYRRFVEGVVKAASGTHPPRSEPTQTLAQLEAAYAKNPDDLGVSARLAEKYAESGKTSAARKLVDEVLAKDKTHPRASAVKARLLLRDKDDAGAKAVLTAALADWPDDPRLLLALGKLHVTAKEWAEAATVLERGRKAAPLEGDWLDPLAKVYAETKQSTELAVVLAETAAQDPDALPVRLTLAKLHAAAGRHAEAETWGREVLAIDVKHEEGRALLLDALRAQKKDAEAERIAKRYEK